MNLSKIYNVNIWVSQLTENHVYVDLCDLLTYFKTDGINHINSIKYLRIHSHYLEKVQITLMNSFYWKWFRIY